MELWRQPVRPDLSVTRSVNATSLRRGKRSTMLTLLWAGCLARLGVVLRGQRDQIPYDRGSAREVPGSVLMDAVGVYPPGCSPGLARALALAERSALRRVKVRNVQKGYVFHSGGRDWHRAKRWQLLRGWSAEWSGRAPASSSGCRTLRTRLSPN
jgi:hypothetical protein